MVAVVVLVFEARRLEACLTQVQASVAVYITPGGRLAAFAAADPVDCGGKTAGVVVDIRNVHAISRNANRETSVSIPASLLPPQIPYYKPVMLCKRKKRTGSEIFVALDTPARYPRYGGHLRLNRNFTILECPKRGFVVNFRLPLTYGSRP